jgi:hypothetical protein
MTKDQKDIIMKNVFDIMKSYGMNLSEIISTRNDIAEIYKDEYPFIEAQFDSKSNALMYHSTHPAISSYYFYSKKEVILVNAIYENTRINFNANKFVQDFTYTFKLLGIKSEWV